MIFTLSDIYIIISLGRFKWRLINWEGKKLLVSNYHWLYKSIANYNYISLLLVGYGTEQLSAPAVKIKYSGAERLSASSRIDGLPLPPSIRAQVALIKRGLSVSSVLYDTAWMLPLGPAVATSASLSLDKYNLVQACCAEKLKTVQPKHISIDEAHRLNSLMHGVILFDFAELKNLFVMLYSINVLIDHLFFSLRQDLFINYKDL